MILSILAFLIVTIILGSIVTVGLYILGNLFRLIVLLKIDKDFRDEVKELAKIFVGILALGLLAWGVIFLFKAL